jgi:peroxiredoxin Q/BCP
MKGLVRVGDIAPDFELPDQNGNAVRLSDLLVAGPVVLFFYPLAMSRGCTAQSCHFRDLAAEFAVAGATRVGVSRDSVARQLQFDTDHHLGYRLLSDAEGRDLRVWCPKNCSRVAAEAEHLRHRV